MVCLNDNDSSSLNRRIPQQATCATMSSMSKTWAIAIHGGAGVIERSLCPEAADLRIRVLEAVITSAGAHLASGQSALDVVEHAVVQLEEAAEFNAGKGAVFTADGRHELEAAIMDGRSGTCGAACLLTTVRNPVRLARRVLDQSPHVLLAGQAAEQLVGDLEQVPNDWFDTELRRAQWSQWKQASSEADARGPATVGAVAMDINGHLAAATSTGGRTGKPSGRIGDTPMIGAGTWADERCAVSGTGHGEAFMATAAAHTVAARMAYGGDSLDGAASRVVQEALPPGSGGLIAVDAHGEISMPFNCEGMYRAAADSKGRFEAKIWT